MKVDLKFLEQEGPLEDLQESSPHRVLPQQIPCSVGLCHLSAAHENKFMKTLKTKSNTTHFTYVSLSNFTLEPAFGPKHKSHLIEA
jgi:hypothetical protein